MDTYRVGVIADTHVPELLSALPVEVAGLFQGVDLILHAGDITCREVLDELRLVAPVVAVQGTMIVSTYQAELLSRLGAVYQLTPEQAKVELGRTCQLLSLIYLLNALRRRPVAPSVGLLTIEDGTIKADILPLTR